MSRLVITHAAASDIDAIWDYIAERSIEGADRLVNSIYEEIRRIGSQPGIGHRRADLAAERPILFWPLGRYLLLYRHNSEQTVIVAVLHGSRDIPAALREREEGD